jgi:hypothetical protein
MGDLQALAQAGVGGSFPSAAAVAYIEKRLDEARGLQLAGLRRLPISSTGHLGLARLELGRCAVTSMSGRPAGECATSAMREFRATVALAPMSAALHAQVARILLTGWPLFDGAERAEGRSIIDRAIALNPADRDLAGARLAMATAPEG